MTLITITESRLWKEHVLFYTSRDLQSYLLMAAKNSFKVYESSCVLLLFGVISRSPQMALDGWQEAHSGHVGHRNRRQLSSPSPLMQ